MTRFTPPAPVVPGLRVIEAHFFQKDGQLRCAMLGAKVHKHICESCKHVYTAEQRERAMDGKMVGDTPENRKKVRESTERLLGKIFDKRAPENPCPKCGWLSQASVKQIQHDRKVLRTGIAAFITVAAPIGIVFMILKGPQHKAWSTFDIMFVLTPFLLGCVATAVTWAVAGGKDPNGDATERKKRQLAAAAGTYGRKGFEDIPIR